MTPNAYDSSTTVENSSKRSAIVKQAVVPVIALIVGLVAFVITANYFHGREQDIQEEINRINRGAKKVEILVAKQRIPRGDVLRAKRGDIEGNLSIKTVYSTQVGGNNVTVDDASYVIGRKTVLPLEIGEAVFWSSVEGGRKRNTGLSSTIPDGMRAISIPVSGAATVSGMVRPTDRVDVLGTFSLPGDREGEMTVSTITLLQDVTVQATGDQTAKSVSSRRSSNYGMVTLLVTPQEAEWLKFMEQMKGSLSLSLRNPSDGGYLQNLSKVNFQEIEETLIKLNKFRQTIIRKRKWQQEP